LIASLLTTIPAGILLLGGTAGFTWRRLRSEHVWPWALRAAPVWAAAAIVGFFHREVGLWLAFVATAIVSLAYVWHMRPMYGALLALDPRWTPWLAMMRLVPAPARAENGLSRRVNIRWTDR
jgi:hypothetical protein